jgi:hypothetical protein
MSRLASGSNIGPADFGMVENNLHLHHSILINQELNSCFVKHRSQHHQFGIE